MRRALIVCVILGLCGCATQETAQSLGAKTLLSARQTVIAGAVAVDALCEKRMLGDADCKTAATSYLQAELAYATASDALELAVKSGQADDWKKYIASQSNFQQLAADATKLYNAFRGVTP